MRNRKGESFIITIEIGEKEYDLNSIVDVSLINKSSIVASYLKCTNAVLWPSKILKKENENWIENDYAIPFTAMGPMGYFGLFEEFSILHDSIIIYNQVGKLKLRYKFIVDKDTMEFDSNEFNLKNIE